MSENLVVVSPPSTQIRRKANIRFLKDRIQFDRRPFISLLAGVVLWEVGVRLFVDHSLFIVPLSDVAVSFVEMLQTGELQTHFSTSALEFVAGFALASVIGILIGAIMGASDTVRAYLDPWISALYSTPLLAIAPLLILIFGLGLTSKIAVVFLVAVFVVLINTYTGLVNTPPHLLECARAFGANRVQLFTKVRIPAALPMIVAGERLAISRAITGVVVAEFFGARAGLGYLILLSSQRFDTAKLFFGIVLLAVQGILLIELLKLVESRLAPWRKSEGQG